MKAFLQHIKAGEIVVPAGEVELQGNLNLPEDATGIVLFAHGSGSSRHSPRNRFVAETLNSGGLGTLLIDLLSSEEEAVDLQTTHLRFDIMFLAERLLYAMKWMRENPATEKMKLGLFGSSTGAGAALVAAAEQPKNISAVVSRGGRPDLAGAALSLVRCPTLLIVGGNDSQVIELNKQAAQQLQCEKKMEIVPRASHLFEEPGALQKVSELASNWFQKHLG